MRLPGVLFLILALSSCGVAKKESRQTADFNFNWVFAKGDLPGAEAVACDDEDWQKLKLPHDWSIGEVFVNDMDAGRQENAPGGIGWYRKHFSMPESASGRITWIEFDGIYNHSDVWINGHHLGSRPYGYVPFSYDLSQYLNYGNEENVITVRVDRTSFQDSRWYSGSGIYRNVKLVTVSPVHFPQWGVQVRTPQVSDEKARVEIHARLLNRGREDFVGGLEVELENGAGTRVASGESDLVISAGSEANISLRLEVSDPLLWDTENPNMYLAVCRIKGEEGAVDELVVPFGIRTFHYDPESGFYLNGKATPFKGVCLHHDGGSVGAAVPIGIWERRLHKLKEAGCNAIRTAHNPPSEEFLDLCDRMGFLVQDEAFDEFHNPKDKRNNYKELKAEDITRGYAASFEKWAEADVKAMVRRDRNHPSIVQWSIGNEIEWTFPRYGNSTGYWGQGNDVNYYDDEPPYELEEMKKRFYGQEPDNYPLAETAKKLAGWIREEDPTRPVTANLVIPSVSFFSGYTDALDVVGLSYRNAVYDYIHRLYPEKMIFGTENWGSWHEWKPVLEREFIPGIFLWTGINYLGETSRSARRGSGSGLLDFACFEKPRYHMYKTLWNDDPHIFMNTVKLAESDFLWDEATGKVDYKREDGWKYYRWGWQPFNYHWNYEQGDSTVVEVFTNREEAELFLNDESLGVKYLEDFEDHIIKWLVPYAPGELRVEGRTGGVSCEYLLSTSGDAASISLTADKGMLRADNYDVVHLVAGLMDGKGNPVLHEDMEIEFKVEGPATIIGTDNGSNRTRTDYRSPSLMTWNGKCLLILQAGDKKGKVRVSARGEGIVSGTVEINLK